MDALRRAVAIAPDDLDLAVHLAEQLVSRGQRPEAVQVVAGVLGIDPAHVAAQRVMGAALAPAVDDGPGVAVEEDGPGPAGGTAGFDWLAAEQDVGPVSSPARFGAERPEVTLADVGGLERVKARLEAAFLTPLRNPELRQAYAKSLRGGLLLYGPPGCGKTFLARALAGELGASFLHLGIADVLDRWIGSSERNLHDAFEAARAAAPCVLFLDEIDTLGHARSRMVSESMQGVVNQLLQELDGVGADNEGVFLLAATNQPWDIDPALRRPGRLDRTVLVLPPDRAARAAILRHHLVGRPVEGVDVEAVAGLTAGFSGADLAHVCEAAAEQALMRSVRSGVVGPVRQQDLRAAVNETAPSVGAWLEVAKNVVRFGRDDGTHAELREYLRAGSRR